MQRFWDRHFWLYDHLNLHNYMLIKPKARCFFMHCYLLYRPHSDFEWILGSGASFPQSKSASCFLWLMFMINQQNISQSISRIKTSQSVFWVGFQIGNLLARRQFSAIQIRARLRSERREVRGFYSRFGVKIDVWVKALAGAFGKSGLEHNVSVYET